MKLRVIVITQVIVLAFITCGCSVLLEKGGDYIEHATTPTPLFAAIDFGSLEWVKEEVDSGANLNEEQSSNLLSRKMRPIQYAYDECFNEAIPNYLIEAGTDLTFCDSQGDTLLFSAALRPDGVELCRQYLEHGIDINHVNNNGDTALDMAAKEGYYSTAEFLIDNGATVSQHTLEEVVQGVNGQGYEHLDLVQLIVNNCSPTNINNVLPPLIVEAIKGNSPYLICAESQDIANLSAEQKRMLGYSLVAFCNKDALAHCFDIGLSYNDWDLAPLDIAAQYGNISTLSWLLENKSIFSEGDLSITSALYSAVSAGQYQTSEYLLDNAITVSFASPQGESFSYLDLAAMSGNIQLFELLVERGSPICNQVIISSFGIAVQKGEYEMGEAIWDHIDFSSITDSEKETIWKDSFPCLSLLERCSQAGLSKHDNEMLLNAVQLNRTDILQFLLKNGNKISYEALSSAVSLGYLDAVKLMVAYGADVNQRDTDGDLPIISIAAMSSAHITKYLIKSGADVNSKSEDGTTALMFAVMRDRVPCVQLLLEAGADLSSTNSEGNSVFDIAETKQNPDILELLSAF